MNLGQVFDTLEYGKGSATRNDYYFYVSVSSEGNFNDLGYVKVEEKTTNFYVTYKGETVLIIKQVNKGRTYETILLYDGRMKHNFHRNINKTLDRIVSYMIEPYSVYKEKYNV